MTASLHSSPEIEVVRLTKSFGRGHPALDGVTLSVAPGEMVALIGASGSGKSTLLRHLAGFAPADVGSGPVRVAGRAIQENGRIAPRVRTARAQIGFVFQQFNLVGRLSVLTNVLVGALSRTPRWRALTGRFREEDRLLALRALERVGIAEHAARRASQLSGGQQQRVAIARALVQKARVILADEPIASLDPESARNVMEILSRINREEGLTVLVSLHQVAIAKRYCARAVALRAGTVVYDGPSAELTEEQLQRLYGTDASELLGDEPMTQPAAPSAPALDGVRLAASST